MKSQTSPSLPYKPTFVIGTWLLVTYVLELDVLGFGLSVDGKIGVGVFPNAKEFFIRFAGGCVVAHQSPCPTELKPGQGSDDMSHAKTGIVDELLELRRGQLAIAEPRYASPLM